MQEGNHYDAIATQSIGPDSLYRWGERCWIHPLIYLYLSSYGLFTPYSSSTP